MFNGSGRLALTPGLKSRIEDGAAPAVATWLTGMLVSVLTAGPPCLGTGPKALPADMATKEILGGPVCVVSGNGMVEVLLSR